MCNDFGQGKLLNCNETMPPRHLFDPLGLAQRKYRLIQPIYA